VTNSTESDRVEIQGPVRQARNSLSGGLHDGILARRHGFAGGGLIGGNMHLDRFPPVLVEAFGSEWVGRGSISVYFETAVGAGCHLQVSVRAGRNQSSSATRLRRVEDDATVGAGTASARPGQTDLQTRDLRIGNPSELVILRDLQAEQVLAEGTRYLPAQDQIDRIAQGEIDDTLPCWTDPKPWKGAVACPSTIVSLLYEPGTGASPVAQRACQVYPGAASMFGAIELRFVDGPILLDHAYRIVSTVVGVGQSPRTEYCWWDSMIKEPSGKLAATARILTRVFKPAEQ
jgi:hypothetical protein